jgi:hypothetical protein
MAPDYDPPDDGREGYGRAARAAAWSSIATSQVVVQSGQRAGGCIEGEYAGPDGLGQGRTSDPGHHDVGTAAVVHRGHRKAQLAQPAHDRGLALGRSAVAITPQHQPVVVLEDVGVAAGG